MSKPRICSYCNKSGHQRNGCPQWRKPVKRGPTPNHGRSSGKSLSVDEVRIAFRLMGFMQKPKKKEHRTLSLEFIAEIIGCSPNTIVLLNDAFEKGTTPQKYVEDRELSDRRGKNPKPNKREAFQNGVRTWITMMNDAGKPVKVKSIIRWIVERHGLHEVANLGAQITGYSYRINCFSLLIKCHLNTNQVSVVNQLINCFARLCPIQLQ
jgi:hypothetical protein